MYKKIVYLIISVIFIICVLFLSGCNRQIIDIHYSYKYAIISMPDGSIVSGEVDSWRDYSDSDAIQVTINGHTYYTFLDNVVLYD